MKPAPFDLHRARSVTEVVELLGRFHDRGEEAKPIAGGQSLVPMMNFRLARPQHLIDLAGVAELGRIEVDRDRISIGATVTQRDCLADPAIRTRLPMLAAGLEHIGHSHIRNRGTVGGSIAHADPAAELPAVLLALGGAVEVAGPDGRRTVPAAELFRGWFTTGLDERELLTAVVFPTGPVPARVDAESGSGVDVGSGSGADVGVGAGTVEWGFEELARRDGDFAMVLAATLVERDRSGTVTAARIALGGVGATPIRAEAAERSLIGSTGGERFEMAAAEARSACRPSSDAHADAAYRSEMVAVLVERCLRAGADRPAGGDQPAGVDRSAAPGLPSPPAGPVPVADPVVADRRSLPADPVDSADSLPADSADPVTSADSAVVNGDVHRLDGVPDRRLLADWLRDDLDLTGTHLGCEHGVCGACTVLIDGSPMRSCLVFARQVDGRAVTTVEQLGTPTSLHPIQEAFRANHGLQCGFCTPGMVLAVSDLLARIPDPTDDQIRHELSGNLCRCTGYVKIVDAVRAAAVELRSGSRQAERSDPSRRRTAL